MLTSPDAVQYFRIFQYSSQTLHGVIAKTVRTLGQAVWMRT
jgi:hypothetical protein